MRQCYADCSPSYFGEDLGPSSIRRVRPVQIVSISAAQSKLHDTCGQHKLLQHKRIALVSSFGALGSYNFYHLLSDHMLTTFMALGMAASDLGCDADVRDVYVLYQDVKLFPDFKRLWHCLARCASLEN